MNIDLTGVIDLVPILQHALGSFPLWAMMYLIVQSWMKNNKKEHDKVEEQLFLINKKLSRIELILASSGIQTLKEDIVNLKESKAKDAAKFDELFRRMSRLEIKPVREN